MEMSVVNHLTDGNEIVGEQIPPTNGWMLELGYGQSEEEWRCSYRIYISGDTLLVPSLNEIRDRYSHLGIDLLLLHLGGTTIPSPSLPLLMVTMDAKQGIELINLVKPDVAIPIHYEYVTFLTKGKRSADRRALVITTSFFHHCPIFRKL